MTEGNYIPLTDEAIDDVKEYLKKVVAYAEYRSGNTWTKIPIDHVETLSDGRIAIYVMFDHNAPDSITEFASIIAAASYGPAVTKA